MSLHATWKEGISIFIPNFFNFGKSIVIAWPASRIMLTNNVDNVEKNPKNPCKVTQVPLANIFWGTCLGELGGTFEPKISLQPSHSKIVKLLFQAGWRTSNRHILALKTKKFLICDFHLLSWLPSTWSVNLALVSQGLFLFVYGGTGVSMHQNTGDTEVTGLWSGSSHWVTQSSKSLISSWPLSWLLHCRFSINVGWPLYVHGPHCTITYLWDYCCTFS